MYQIKLGNTMLTIKKKFPRLPSTAEEIADFMGAASVGGVSLAELITGSEEARIDGGGYRVEISQGRKSTTFLVDGNVLRGNTENAVALHVRTEQGWKCCAFACQEPDVDRMVKYARCYTPIALVRRGKIDTGLPFSEATSYIRGAVVTGGAIAISSLDPLLASAGPLVSTAYGPMALGTILAMHSAILGVFVAIGGVLIYAGIKAAEKIEERKNMVSVILTGQTTDIVQGIVGIGAENAGRLVVCGALRSDKGQWGTIKLTRRLKENESLVVPTPVDESGWGVLRMFAGSTMTPLIVSPPAVKLVGNIQSAVEMPCVVVASTSATPAIVNNVLKVDDRQFMKTFGEMVSEQKR